MIEQRVGDFDSWRPAARDMLMRGVLPTRIRWSDAASRQSLLPLDKEPPVPVPSRATFDVPHQFLKLARHVACHRNPERWHLLYDALWRITHGERHLLEIAVDETVHTLRQMEKAVHRDIHKMHAFVRFENARRTSATSTSRTFGLISRCSDWQCRSLSIASARCTGQFSGPTRRPSGTEANCRFFQVSPWTTMRRETN